MEEVSIQYGAEPPRLAGFWPRLAGFVIDGVIVAVLNLVVVRALRLPGVLETNCPRGQICTIYSVDMGALALRQMAGLGLAFAYSSLLLVLNRGRTLGMMAAGVRVGSPDGSAVLPARLFARQAFAIVSRLPAYLGFLWAAWDAERRTWHDAVAGTRVFATR